MNPDRLLRASIALGTAGAVTAFVVAPFLWLPLILPGLGALTLGGLGMLVWAMLTRS